jgi:hypothetical protein
MSRLREGRAAKKPKFKPAVTRVKLNPEQAVLSCDCYSANLVDDGPAYTLPPVCTRTKEMACAWSGAGATGVS